MSEDTTAAGSPRLRVLVTGLPDGVDGDLVFVDPQARWADPNWLEAQVEETIRAQL